MSVRVKLSVLLLSIVAFTFLLASAVAIDRTVDQAVDTLSDSGTTVLNQVIYQTQSALTHVASDPYFAIRRDPVLAAYLDSAHEFAKGVIFVRMETPDGVLLSGTPDYGFEKTAQPFAKLRNTTHLWSPAAQAGLIWGNQVYELEGNYQLNHGKFVVIKVGISTALITGEVRQYLVVVGTVTAIIIAAAVLGAFLAGAIMLRPITTATDTIEWLLRDENSSPRNKDASTNNELQRFSYWFNRLSDRVLSDRAERSQEYDQFVNIIRTTANAVIILNADGTIFHCDEEVLPRLGLPGGGVVYGKPLSAILGDNHPVTHIVSTAKGSTAGLCDIPIEIDGGARKPDYTVSVFPLGIGIRRSKQLLIIDDEKGTDDRIEMANHSIRFARVGELMSGAAHQIRNPLNAMALELELLSQDVRDGKVPEERIHRFREDMSRFAQSVDSLIQFISPEKLNLENVPINEIISEAARTAVDTPIEVAYDLDLSNPPVRADREVLTDGLRKLVQNAIEAMQAGGTLEIRTRSNDGCVDISLRDTGTGISAGVRERVTHIYFTTKDSGAGLGLPMAIRAVALHGGMLTLSSIENVGTTVKIRLPAVTV